MSPTLAVPSPSVSRDTLNKPCPQPDWGCRVSFAEKSGLRLVFCNVRLPDLLPQEPLRALIGPSGGSGENLGPRLSHRQRHSGKRLQAGNRGTAQTGGDALDQDGGSSSPELADPVAQWPMGRHLARYPPSTQTCLNLGVHPATWSNMPLFDTHITIKNLGQELVLAYDNAVQGTTPGLKGDARACRQSNLVQMTIALIWQTAR